MNNQEVQVVRAGKHWAVRSARKLISSHRSQDAAIEAALKMAKKARGAVIIQREPFRKKPKVFSRRPNEGLSSVSGDSPLGNA